MAKRTINGRRMILKNKTDHHRKSYFALRSMTALLCSVSVILVSNFPLLSASENHVIEVTASICENSEKNIVFNWNENMEIYQTLLPQKIGNEIIENADEASGMLMLKNDLNIRNDLKSKLLALKFNMAYIGIGENITKDDYVILENIANEADALLAADPPPLFTELEDVKIKIEKANEYIRSGICRKDDTGSAVFSDSASHGSTVLINKIGFESEEGAGTGHGWVELYNRGPDDINMKDWQICNSETCNILDEVDIFIPGYGYAVIAPSGFNIKDCDMPDEAIIIVLEGNPWHELENASDMLELMNESGTLVDSLNWGKASIDWKNYRENLWDPGIIPSVVEGSILKRIRNGLDTDSASDWEHSKIPRVDLLFPDTDEALWVGKIHEIRWDATNYIGIRSDLRISIWYSTDNGNSWANIASNEENTGVYKWRMPLYIDGYFTVSPEAKIKIVAIYNDNFMIQNYAISENTFSPSIDFANLTSDEKLQAAEIGLISNNDNDTHESRYTDDLPDLPQNMFPEDRSEESILAENDINKDLGQNFTNIPEASNEISDAQAIPASLSNDEKTTNDGK